MKGDRTDRLFIAAPFFLARVAAFPIDLFFNLIDHKDCLSLVRDLYQKEGSFREAIATASPSLYKSLKMKSDKSPKEEQKFANLLKYAIRMTTRATPFGLFSFVATGNLDDRAEVKINLCNVEKRIRPDMEWFLKIVDQISEDPSHFMQLYVKINPLILLSGERIVLDYLRQKEPVQNIKKKSEGVTIRATPLVNLILSLAKSPIKIEDLKDKILAQFPDLEVNRIKEVILKLIKQQILSHDLLPSLLTESPFRILLDKISKSEIFPLKSSLKALHDSFLTYHQMPFGQGEDYLVKLEEQMIEMASSSRCVQIDSIDRKDEFKLPSRIAEELSEAAEMLWRIPFYFFEENVLKQYHNQFLEKYGIYRIVPIRQLLSNDEGLGLPEFYEKEIEKQVLTPLQKQWRKWLKNAWVNCLYDKMDEITITDEIISQLGDTQRPFEKALPSFEAYFQLIANSQEEINAGNFLINFSAVSWQAGSTFGRFSDLFSELTTDKLQHLLKEEEKLDPEVIMAESSYLPYSPNFANVSTQKKLRKHYLDLNCDSPSLGSLSLEDIFVGATMEKFYLTNATGSIKYIIGANNMLNHNAAPSSLRFMRDVSKAYYKLIYPFVWEDVVEGPFFPRVKYKRIVLSPASWKLDIQQLGLTTKNSLDEIASAFTAWCQRWRVPTYIFYGIEDQKILINRNIVTHLKEILAKLKMGDEIKLVEKLGQKEGEWIATPQGKHAAEFVLPFLRNPKYTNSTSSVPTPSHLTIPLEKRMKMLGSDWLFAKFYLNREQEDYFLIEHIAPFADYLLQEKIIEKWFYVRYRDSSPHLRIRFKGNPEALSNVLIPILNAWSHSLLSSNLLREMSLSSYEREIERYGGVDLIDLADNCFCADSATSIEILKIMASERIENPECFIVPLSLINLLKNFGLSLEEQRLFFASLNLSKNHLKGYREWKNKMIPYVQKIFNLSRQEVNFQSSLLESFAIRKSELEQYRAKINELHLSNSKLSCSSIQQSLIHMHCNRLMGYNLNLETKSYVYALQVLQDVLQLSKLKFPAHVS
jgi:thiopeptide-type bacteriocin biosynthesis protein